MAKTLQKNKIKIKTFVFGVDEQPQAALKIGINLESVGTGTSQLAGLVLSLIKFELLRRNAYKRWQMYLNQVGLKLQDLTVYLDVLHDDSELVSSLKNYCVKISKPEYDKVELLRESNQLKENLIQKIKQLKVLNTFPIRQVRTIEQIVE
jgi:hypothetical protein